MRAIDADAFIAKCGNWYTEEGDAETGYIGELKYLIEKQPTIQSEPHWIPCSDGLPKEEGFYLVTLEDKCGAETTIRFFRIENGERQWSLWGNENITAWMPKPEPYKGVTE